MPKWVKKTIKIQSWRKISKGSICNLSWFRMFTKKEQSCQNNNNNNNNNLDKLYTVKKAKHELSGWAMFTKCSFDKKENKLDYYRGKHCVKS